MRISLITMCSAVALMAAPAFAQTTAETPVVEAPAIVVEQGTTAAGEGTTVMDEETTVMDEERTEDTSILGDQEDVPEVGVVPPPPVERPSNCAATDPTCELGDQGGAASSQ